MSSSKSWLARTGRALADRLDRLRYSLDTLRERLREAVSRAVGQSVAGAVQDAVNAALDTSPGNYDRRDQLHEDPDYYRQAWHENQDSPWQENYDSRWHDHPEYWRDPNDEREEPSSAAAESGASTVGKALMVGCETAAWWLRRWTGEYSVLVALGVGAVTATITYTGGPIIAAGIGLVGATLGLMNLGQTVQAGAAALDSRRMP